MSDPGPAAAHRREVRVAVVGCVLAAAALLIVSGQAWLDVGLAAVPPLPAVRQSLTGPDVVSSLVPGGILIGASGLALIATGRVGRQVVAVALVAAGLLVVGTVGFFLYDDGVLAAANWAQERSPALGDSAFPDRDVSVAPASVAVLAGLLALAIGVFAVVRSKRWPVMGARYERGSRASATDTEEGGTDVRAVGDPESDGGSPAADEAAMWTALERGEDPTATLSPPQRNAAGQATPDRPVHGR